jgi:hypothetical protein
MFEMEKNGESNSMRGLTFVLCAATAQILSVSGAAHAQTEQTIAMVCRSELPGQSTITINLAEKTVLDEYAIFSVPVSVTHGAVTQASEAEIAFNIWSDGYLRQGILNRHTGMFVFRPLNALRTTTDRLAASFNKASCREAPTKEAELGLSPTPVAQDNLVAAALPDEPAQQSQSAPVAPSLQTKKGLFDDLWPF